MRLDDYQALGGHTGYVRPLAEVLAAGAWHNDGAPTGRRVDSFVPANAWPLGMPPMLG
jgi:6-hydroxynicotinate reductase